MARPVRVRELVARTVAGDGVVGALGWVALGSMVANAAAYVVYLGAGRWLTPGDYGQFARLLSAMLIFGVPALALQSVIAREVVHGLAGRAIRTLTWQTAVGVALAAAVGVPVVATIAATGGAATAAALAAAPLLVLIAAGQGVLQGLGEFRALAWVLAVVGVVRSAPMLVVFAVGGGYEAGIVTGTASAGLAAAIVWLVVAAVGRTGSRAERDQRTARQQRAALAGGQHHSPPAGARVTAVLRASQVQLVLVVLVSVDLLLSGTALGADDAGVYALGAVATKAAFWLPQAIGVVFYPRLADPARSRASLRQAVAVVAAIGAVLTVAAGVAGPVIPIVIGEAYRPLVPILWLFAYTGAALSVLQVLLLSAIAADRTRVALLSWAVVAIEGAIILTVVDSVVALAVTAAVGVTTAVAATGVTVMTSTAADASTACDPVRR